MEISEVVFPQGYQVLRPLTSASPVYLCSEHATGRLVVLKYFSEKRARVFAQEARTLDHLSAFDGSPLLYFASQHPPEQSGDHRYYIGIEYLAGKSLLELKLSGNLEPARVAGLGRRLKAQVARLHEEWGVAHGDLSPKNVLVAASRDGREDRIVFVDWEFAVKASEQKVNHYTQFRGTVGYADAADLRSLKARDERAVEACMAFLSEGLPGVPLAARADSKRAAARGIYRWIWDRNSSR